MAISFTFILQERKGRRGRLRRRERGEGKGGRQRCNLIGGSSVSDLWTIRSFKVYLQTVSQHFPLPKYLKKPEIYKIITYLKNLKSLIIKENKYTLKSR